MKKYFIVILTAFILLSLPALAVGSPVPTPNEGADAPEIIYTKYSFAVHQGDVNEVIKYIYSDSIILWKKNPKTMFSITKNMVPQNPALISKKAENKGQECFMVLNLAGTSSKGQGMTGEVKMILENGEWKVYQEKWNMSK